MVILTYKEEREREMESSMNTLQKTIFRIIKEEWTTFQFGWCFKSRKYIENHLYQEKSEKLKT